MHTSSSIGCACACACAGGVSTTGHGQRGECRVCSDRRCVGGKLVHVGDSGGDGGGMGCVLFLLEVGMIDSVKCLV